MRRVRQRAAGIVLFREREGREYLLLRSALTRRPVWEFPKGGIEAGETELEAAERELQEETGLSEGDYLLLGGFREEEHYLFTRGAGAERALVAKSVVYFLARWRSGDVVISDESSDARWAAYDEAHRLVRFAEKRRVLESAERLVSGAAARPRPLVVKPRDPAG